jgi:hypothetical protein
MYDAEWSARRHSHENFNGRDASRHEAHDSDPFYSWGALIPFMSEAEHADASPWDGVTLGDDTGEAATLALPTGQFAVATQGGRMRVSLDGRELVTVTPPARLTHVRADRDALRFHLNDARELHLPGGAERVTVNGEDRVADDDAGRMSRLAAIRGEVTVHTPGRRESAAARDSTAKETM